MDLSSINMLKKDLFIIKQFMLDTDVISEKNYLIVRIYYSDIKGDNDVKNIHEFIKYMDSFSENKRRIIITLDKKYMLTIKIAHENKKTLGTDYTYVKNDTFHDKAIKALPNLLIDLNVSNKSKTIRRREHFEIII